jgi:hypothetical protein
MQLVLGVPGLLAANGTGTAPARAPALTRLLAMAGPPAREAEGHDAALAARYGILRQTDWPMAAIRAAALGIDATGAYWLAADPVTLTVGRDDVAFAGIVDDLARDDADALIATLNAHFADDGVAFVAPRPDAIFARVAAPPRLSTHPPAATPGEPLRMRLPEGPDAGVWRRWQSEIQMLLHEHPVNVARERAGRPPANSVWFSAGGTLPPRAAPELSIRTFADAGVAVALAAHAGSPARAIPPGLASALDLAGDAATVVVALDPGSALGAFDNAWAAPAARALAAGRIAELTLVANDAGDALIWRATRPGFWQRLAGRFTHHELAALVAAARGRD